MKLDILRGLRDVTKRCSDRVRESLLEPGHTISFACAALSDGSWEIAGRMEQTSGWTTEDQVIIRLEGPERLKLVFREDMLEAKTLDCEAADWPAALETIEEFLVSKIPAMALPGSQAP